MFFASNFIMILPYYTMVRPDITVPSMERKESKKTRSFEKFSNSNKKKERVTR